MVDQLDNSGIPAVYISKTNRNFDIYNVSAQNRPAARDMTEFLIEKGHKDIALMVTNYHISDLANERLEGYKEALEKAKIDYREELVVSSGTNYSDGYAAAKELLGKGEKLDAIFATSDEAAVGAINACFDMGYKVPEDISVAGFNDVKLAKIYRPKLTSVYQPLFDMGAVAIRIIIKLIGGLEITEKSVALPYRIMDRESVLDRNNK